MSERLLAHFKSSIQPAARLQKTDTLVESPPRLPEWGEASSRGVRCRPEGWPEGPRMKRTALGHGVWGIPAPGQAFDTFSSPGSRRGTRPPEASSSHPLVASPVWSRVGHQGYGVQPLLTPDPFEC